MKFDAFELDGTPVSSIIVPTHCAVCREELTGDCTYVAETRLPGQEGGNPSRLVGWHPGCTPEWAREVEGGV
jgi:hypothetical protein